MIDCQTFMYIHIWGGRILHDRVPNIWRYLVGEVLGSLGGAKLGQVGSKLGQVGAKLGQVEAKLGHVEPKLAQVGPKIGQHRPT